MKYSFKELVHLPKLQKLTDDLYAATSIPSSIISISGEILTGSGWQKICTDFHRKHPEIEKECIESDTRIRKELEEGEPFVIYQCPRGLVDASAPIVIEGEHVANVFSGQVFLSPPGEAMENFFREQGRKFGFDELEYLEAFKKVPVFTEEKFRSGISFLTSLAEMIADMGLARMRELEALTALRVSEGNLKSFLDAIPESAFLMNTDGTVVMANQTTAGRLGKHPEEMQGRSIFNFIPKSVETHRKQAIEEVVRTKKPVSFEDEHLGRCLYNSVSPIVNEAGEVMRLAIVGVDITEQKQFEKKLREDRDLIERIMETSPAGIVRVDADGRVVYANRRAKDIHGSELSETKGRTFNDPAWNITDFDGNPFPEENLPFSIVKRTGRSIFDVRHAIQPPDSNRILLSVNAAPLLDGNGVFEGMVATLEDITVKIETEQNYQMLFQEMIDGFALHEIIVDDRGRPVDYRFLAVNPAFERLTGLEFEKIAGKTVLEVMPNTEPGWTERYGRVALTGNPVEFEHYSRELERYFHVTAFRPKKNHFACIFEDVTRHRHAEDALKESEARFRSFMDHFPSHIFIKDRQLRFVYGNRAVLDFWKTDPEKFKGTTAYDYFNRENAERIERSDGVVLHEHRVVDEEFMIRRHSGETNWMRVIQFPLAMPNGEWLIGGISIDITEQVYGKEERQRLITAIEQTGESLVITSPDGRIEYVNPAFESITGYTRQEITGRNPHILKSGFHDRSVYETLWATILSGNRWSGRLINRRKDGTYYTSECAITPVRNEQGNILNFVWISRDVSKEVELEKRMLQAQKMESIGNLAGGIAHDFNNILFPILGLTEMLLEDLPSGSPERENAVEIYKAGKRGSELVKQILAFGRKGEQKKLPVRIQQVLREALALARATIPANIELNQSIQKECGRVLADPTRIHQIVMNLVTNAFHAVEETGGKISVGLCEVEPTFDESADDSILPGKYAKLTVSDTGYGIAPEAMEKIFDPYFTTKGHGKGTGLGLAVVYGIVSEHQGEIKVRSEVGKGTTFDVYLPLLGECAEELQAAGDTDVPTGYERILFVDDEKAVARLGRQILERLGYRVTAYTLSADALKAFRADPDEFDLVITDMTMPAMTGELLAREMMSIRPDIPIIICTGYSERIDREKAAAIGVKELLMKPISKSDLGEAVRKVLDLKKADEA